MSKVYLRSWVFVSLLTFVGQLVLGMAHSSTMASAHDSNSAQTPSCHGVSAGSEPGVSTAHSELNGPNNAGACCDGNCSMIGCLAFSALFYDNEFIIPDQHFKQTLNISSPPILKRQDSLYRPPILG